VEFHPLTIKQMKILVLGKIINHVFSIQQKSRDADKLMSDLKMWANDRGQTLTSENYKSMFKTLHFDNIRRPQSYQLFCENGFPTKNKN